MNSRILAFALALLIGALAVVAVIEVVLVPGARAAILACGTSEECARAWDHRYDVNLVELIFGWLAGVGTLLLLPGLMLDEPLPASLRRRVEPPVSWTWRDRNLGPEVRIPLLLVPLAVISSVTLSPWVFAVSFAAFLAPLALRRRSLSPQLIHRSFLLGLGAAGYVTGFVFGGVVGVLCVAFLALTVFSILFVVLPKL